MVYLLDNLKTNFLFQASLGSKELFHSNMLAWFLEQKYKNGKFEVLKMFIKDFTGIEASNIIGGDYPNFRIEREQQNIDLTIKWMGEGNWNLIFIENKMKSIPTTKQLDDYDGKIDKLTGTKTKLKIRPDYDQQLKRNVVKKFILTPFKNEISSSSLIQKWENITYEKHILNFLKNISAFKDEFLNPDIKFVLAKYIELIESQNILLESFDLAGNTEKFKYRKYDFYSSSILNEVKRIRLHDLILKLAHQNISYLIKEKLSNEFKPYIVEDFNDFLGIKGNIFISHNFSRSTGISDVKICISGNQTIGLQLQGNTLKYVSEVFKAKNAKKNKDFAIKLLEKKLWFYDKENNDFYGGNGRDKNLVVEIIDHKNDIKRIAFNSYGLNFIYLNKDVSNYAEKSIDELVDFICNEAKRVIDNIEAYHPK
jgi:serine/threonine protein kinase